MAGSCAVLRKEKSEKRMVHIAEHIRKTTAGHTDRQVLTRTQWIGKGSFHSSKGQFTLRQSGRHFSRLKTQTEKLRRRFYPQAAAK